MKNIASIYTYIKKFYQKFQNKTWRFVDSAGAKSSHLTGTNHFTQLFDIILWYKINFCLIPLCIRSYIHMQFAVDDWHTRTNQQTLFNY